MEYKSIVISKHMTNNESFIWHLLNEQAEQESKEIDTFHFATTELDFINDTITLVYSLK